MKFDYCIQYYDSREEAERAKSKYEKQGYETSHIDAVKEIDEKTGNVQTVYVLQYGSK